MKKARAAAVPRWDNIFMIKTHFLRIRIWIPTYLRCVTGSMQKRREYGSGSSQNDAEPDPGKLFIFTYLIKKNPGPHILEACPSDASDLIKLNFLFLETQFLFLSCFLLIKQVSSSHSSLLKFI